MLKPVSILGVKIDALSLDEVKSRLNFILDKKGKSQIATINSEFIVIAEENPDFKDCLNQSQLKVADGSGILVAGHFLTSKLTKIPILRNIQAFFKLIWYLKLSFIYPKSIASPIPERIAGVDLALEIIKMSIEKDLKIFLLGAGVGVAEKASLKLQTDHYGLKIAGTFSGSPKIEDEARIVELINKHKADIILVAYGAPAQDLWIKRNLKKTTAKIAIGVGGTLDFFSGDLKRAPIFMQKHGLEWLFSTLQQPRIRIKRLWRLFHFLRLVYREKLALDTK
jgi:N-acetylglucosaminyldiphosphoundecaprenol N-acetyl-beta-D-mannosaminyltransferase